MKLKKSLLVLTIICGLLLSCNECYNLDCATSYFGAKYKIIDSKSKKDLLFGNDRIYDNSKIKFYSIKGKDTTYFDYRIITNPVTKLDSTIDMILYYRIDTLFVKLNKIKVDTIFNGFKKRGTKCCGELESLSGARINNGLISLINNGLIILEK